MNELYYRRYQVVACIFSLLAMFGLCSCGPSFKRGFRVPDIDTVEVGERVSFESANYVSVDLFGDGRISDAMVGEVTAGGNVSAVVELALEKALRAKGFSVSEDAPIVISGEVRKWFAEVTEGIPAEVSSEATVYVELLDPASKRLYSGEYSGTSFIKHPALGNSHVKESLSQAMSEAISQVLSDKRLIDVLSSF